MCVYGVLLSLADLRAIISATTSGHPADPLASKIAVDASGSTALSPQSMINSASAVCPSQL